MSYDREKTGDETISAEDEIAEGVLELMVSWGVDMFDPDGLERRGNEITAITYKGERYRIEITREE